MTPRDRVVLEALLPSGGPLPGAFEAGFEEFEARFTREAPASMRLGWRAALFAAAWISPLLIKRLPPLDRLAPEERTVAIEALGKSNSYLLRQLSLLLKAVTCFGYGADPRVRRAIGYE